MLFSISKVKPTAWSKRYVLQFYRYMIGKGAKTIFEDINYRKKKLNEKNKLKKKKSLQTDRLGKGLRH